MGVTLEHLRDTDAPALLRWINDPELAALTSAAPFTPVSEADHAAWFARVRADDAVAIFAIRDHGRLVGSCQLLRDADHPGEAELRIRIGEAEARGRGVGAAALHLLLEQGHEQLGLRRIWLQVLPHNDRAIRLYERAGFAPAGTTADGAALVLDHGAGSTEPSSSDR